MRVTVQIDDERSGADSHRSDPGQAGTSPLGGPADAGASGGGAPTGGMADPGQPDLGTAAPGPSAELAARAARLGAVSAGPAPSGPPGALGTPGFLADTLGAPSAGTPGAPVGAASDHSGGAAPMTDQLMPQGIFP
ncbi:MAG: hypothetical protein JWQ99_3377 [Blastococcus sp.]|jgi:hypothetical protein|nr:hypothetical protein [Blastococcus sp.]